MLSLTFALAAFAIADPPAVSVTIYSTDSRGFDPQQFAAQQRMGYDPNFAWQVPGFGVIRETRTITMKEGLQQLPFTDVAAFIDPTTVGFVDLTDPNTQVLEQNFQFDLVSPSKLLERYLDQTIDVLIEQGNTVSTITGRLLSANQGQLVIDTADKGLMILPASEARVSLGAMPQGFLTKPTLVWKLDAKTAGEHQVRTTYQTAGMTWRADYNLLLSADDTTADLTPWVTLLNVSGAGFENAQLKLIAGDVQRVPSNQTMLGRPKSMMARGQVAEAAGFEEAQLFEYHLYTLPRPTDVAANSSMQLALFPPVTGVPVQKSLVYIGAPQFMGWGGVRVTDADLGNEWNKKVSVFLVLRNDEASKLGMPLPKGRVRVYKQDAKDGSLEFVGEDMIDHTPKNESLRLKLGEAFDVTGERVATDFSMDSNRRTMSESFRITLRNAKSIPQAVQIREPLFRWTNWEITAKSMDFTKLDARTIGFDVTVPPEGSTTVEYTVRYTW